MSHREEFPVHDRRPFPGLCDHPEKCGSHRPMYPVDRATGDYIRESFGKGERVCLDVPQTARVKGYPESFILGTFIDTCNQIEVGLHGRPGVYEPPVLKIKPGRVVVVESPDDV